MAGSLNPSLFGVVMKNTVLYKNDTDLGILEYRPGTEAELISLKLQGWTETKPVAAKPVEPTKKG